jgi:hypothetical protein
MPDYIVKSRITNAITETTVTADTRDEAVNQAVTAPDEQILVLNVSEVPVPPAAASEQKQISAQ